MDTAPRKEPAAHMAATTIEYIPLTAIRASPTNPRKHFDKAQLDELASNIKVQGIIQPLVVRPIPPAIKGAAGVKFEIVSGERRWRAARIAELAHAPSIVRDLGDVEVLEIQITENLQRLLVVIALAFVDSTPGLRAVAKRHKVDVEKIRREVLAPVKPAVKGKKK